MQAFRTQQVIRISLFLFGMYALLAARIFHVQFSPDEDELKNHASKEHRSRWRYGTAFFERGLRGRITDRHGRLFASGYETFDLICDPWAPYQKPALQKNHYALYERLDLLCELLEDFGIEIDRKEIFVKGTEQYRKVERDGVVKLVENRGQKLASGILEHQRAHIMKVMLSRGIQNFGFTPTAEREYPQGELVSDIVGRLGWVGKKDEPAYYQGMSGLEYGLDSLLSPKIGHFVCEKDGRGVEIDTAGYWTKLPEDGMDVRTTIDIRIQSIADRALRSAVEEFECSAGCVLVLDSQTGEILAARGLNKTAKKKAPGCMPFTLSVEPGSTIKPLIAAIAIDQGFIRWSDRFDTNQGAYVFRDQRRSRRVVDSSRHGVLDVAETIIYSSNIAMAMIGHDRMGCANLIQALRKLGLDKAPKFAYPAMARTAMPPDSESRFDVSISVPFGHSIAMSPLTLTGKLNIFATGGVYHEPRLIVEARRGDEVCPDLPKSERLISAGTADQMLEAMEKVVQIGTGKVLKDMPWRVAAKTGTAQALPYKDHKFHSSMVAIAPVSKPRLTIYVGLYDVHGKTIYGGSVAGPVIKQILEETLPLLGVDHDKD